MRAVLIELDVAGVDPEAGLRGIREQLVPAISAMPGFQRGTWLTGNEQGLGLSLTLWETDEQANAFAERFRPGAAPQAGAAVRRCEVRDVAAAV
jgi:heme-degrading monooxygenase HmoA